MPVWGSAGVGGQPVGDSHLRGKVRGRKGFLDWIQGNEGLVSGVDCIILEIHFVFAKFLCNGQVSGVDKWCCPAIGLVVAWGAFVAEAG